MKLDVYAGMLGAGKTTLIKQMLKTAYVGKKIAIIENEVGRVNLDSAELGSASYSVKELTSGCICCTLSGDFTQAIQLLEEQEHPDYIIIEPSGVADLPEVIKACSVTNIVSINRIIMVVNAKKMVSLLTVAGEFLSVQIRTAHTVFLNFADAVTPEKLEEVRQALLAINPALAFVDIPVTQVQADTFPEEYMPKLADTAHREPVETISDEADADTWRSIQGEGQATFVTGPDIRRSPAGQRYANRSGAPLIRFKPNVTEDTWSCTFRKTWTDEEINTLKRSLQDPGAPEIWRIKGYLKKTNGKVQKFDYVYGDVFEQEIEAFNEEKVNILVVIGSQMDSGWLKEHIAALDQENEEQNIKAGLRMYCG